MVKVWFCARPTDQVPYVAAYKKRGTYQEWRDNVLGPANAKPGWIFGILLGLSSPVLPHISAPNGSLYNLAGPSRTGKTYALKAAAGCWGEPTKDGCLHSFETTINAAEGLAESATHIGLCLDELAKAIMKDKGMAMSLIYKLANGQGKSRMNSASKMLRTRGWLCNFIVSSEKTIEGLFDVAGEQQAAGQVIRAFDIDMAYLLPNLPLEQVQQFHRNLEAFYGTAGRELIRRLIDIDDLPERHMRALHHLYDGEDGKIQAAAFAFAILIVVGEIMEIDTSVVDEAFTQWLTEDVDQALDDCFQCAETMLDFIEAKKGVTIRKLIQEDELDPEFDDEAEETPSSRDRDGWYEGDDIYLRAAVAGKFADGIKRERFYDWLIEKGIMDKPRFWKDGKNLKRRYTRRVPRTGTSAICIKFDVVCVEAGRR